MLSSSRRSVLVLLALAGCGFTPALGTSGPAQKLMGAVRAADPVDQSGYDFVKRIEDRFGPPGTAQYDLTYSIESASTGVGITAEGAITRYNLTGSVTWTLLRHADGLRMAGGTVNSFTSYSATGSTVAGLTAKEDAGRRLMTILADQIVTDLMATSAAFPT
jgi:LPS-assembly lipoprotein